MPGGTGGVSSILHNSEVSSQRNVSKTSGDNIFGTLEGQTNQPLYSHPRSSFNRASHIFDTEDTAMTQLSKSTSHSHTKESHVAQTSGENIFGTAQGVVPTLYSHPGSALNRASHIFDSNTSTETTYHYAHPSSLKNSQSHIFDSDTDTRCSKQHPLGLRNAESHIFDQDLGGIGQSGIRANPKRFQSSIAEQALLADNAGAIRPSSRYVFIP
jgi:hypothetical protein